MSDRPYLTGEPGSYYAEQPAVRPKTLPRDMIDTALERLDQDRESNPYASIYRESRARRQTADADHERRYRGMSALERAITEDRDNRLAVDIMSGPSPDNIARESRVARAAGQPPALVGDVDAAEKAVNAKRMRQVFGRYPAFGRWAAENPRGAMTAQDDHDTLDLIGDAFEGLRNIRQRLLAGAIQTGADMLGNDDLLKNIDPTNPFLRIASDLTQGIRVDAATRLKGIASTEREKGRADSWLADTALSGLESLPVTVAAAMTRNPTMAAAIPALSVRGNALAKGREQGLSDGKAQVYSVLQGGTEYLSEKFAATGLVNALVNKTPIGKTIMRQLATELPGEQIATFVQDLTDWAMLPENNEKTVGDFWAARPIAIAETLVASTTGTVAQTSVAVAADRTFRAAGKLAERVGQAKDARQAATQLDRLEKAVTTSKFRGRDRDGFAEMIGELGREQNMEYIHLPAGAVAAFALAD